MRRLVRAAGTVITRLPEASGVIINPRLLTTVAAGSEPQKATEKVDVQFTLLGSSRRKGTLDMRGGQYDFAWEYYQAMQNAISDNSGLATVGKDFCEANKDKYEQYMEEQANLMVSAIREDLAEASRGFNTYYRENGLDEPADDGHTV